MLSCFSEGCREMVPKSEEMFSWRSNRHSGRKVEYMMQRHIKMSIVHTYMRIVKTWKPRAGTRYRKPTIFQNTKWKLQGTNVKSKNLTKLLL